MTSTISLGGFTTNGAIYDSQTIDPFAAVTVADSFAVNVSATIAFTAANGVLSSPGNVLASVVSGSTVTYSFSATTPALLQSVLRALVFTPTMQSGAAGPAITTAFSLTVTDISATPSRTLSSGVNNPQSVATDAAGDVFVGNGSNDTVEEFSSTGALLRTLSSGISGPVAVATDSDRKSVV